MRDTWVREAIGKRMKDSAKAADLSVTALSRRLGVEVPTIYRWWKGQRIPAAPRMEQYAAAVGREVSWMYGSVDDEQALHDATEILLKIARMVSQGKRTESAYDEVTRAPEELSLRERQDLSDADGRLSQFFRDLPEDESSRRAFLRQVALLLKANGR